MLRVANTILALQLRLNPAQVEVPSRCHEAQAFRFHPEVALPVARPGFRGMTLKAARPIRDASPC